jgi:hypothetical protein
MGWMKRAGSALAFAAAVLAVVPTGAQQPPPLSAFDGDWRFSGGQRETQQMSAALDQVVDQMNMLMREFARGQIHDRIPLDRDIRIGIHGTTGFSLVLGGWGPVEVPLGGAFRDVTDREGQPIRVSATYAGGRITEHQVRDDSGRRTNTFVLDDENRRLTMWVRIHSDQLPADIVYHLSYRHPQP